MKKTITPFLTAAALGAALLTGCGPSEPADEQIEQVPQDKEYGESNSPDPEATPTDQSTTEPTEATDEPSTDERLGDPKERKKLIAQLPPDVRDGLPQEALDDLPIVVLRQLVEESKANGGS